VYKYPSKLALPQVLSLYTPLDMKAESMSLLSMTGHGAGIEIRVYIVIAVFEDQFFQLLWHDHK
jgi:hypothetical protein